VYKIGIIGLGYVGLPLAVEFGKKFQTIGYDFNEQRVNELNNFIDNTMEVSKTDLLESTSLTITTSKLLLKSVTIFIITVPTPINIDKSPDLTFLVEACKLVSEFLKNGDIVVFESTVYPGTTEDICVPILENLSNLKLNFDFSVGYSPERINPGDKVHTLKNIIKVTSGSNAFSEKVIAEIYGEIITAGIFQAKSIKTAEAAKIIENTQRDINIALMNELEMIFTKLDLNIFDILDTARTKWNFLDFRPGLVGGHCIGVDPYYLAHKAKSVGINPKVILSGRETNEEMSIFYAEEFLNSFNKNEVSNLKILVLGYTFKENCPDIRNTKVSDLVRHLILKSAEVTICDPYVIDSDFQNMEHDFISYSHLFNAQENRINPKYFSAFDGIIVAVAHNEFISMKHLFVQLTNSNDKIYDIKGIL
jgi:UDP-N-acetyl-D-galactosamine dehydrogenase